eukprot:CAMPEP_0114559234 /NCGR_PEP_ID=MMETSP0114-20121206/10812_1 /TAXON_ID=31324 /ORGANISM="Goniomonas sp, Strain m" /LENGTH=52 /DNA_ID=CAMNT_0001744689 /DNA_START=85 /DNA_END=243 /DNA_ORIENTATION=+
MIESLFEFMGHQVNIAKTLGLPTGRLGHGGGGFGGAKSAKGKGALGGLSSLF